MIDERGLKLIEKVISLIDSFQQDYGQFRYCFTVHSYANYHMIVCHILGEKKRIEFIIEEKDEPFLYDIFKQKSDELMGL